MAHVVPPLPPGYRIERVTQDGPPYTDQVLDLWQREGVALGGREGRRVYEVLFVGVHDSDGVIGETSAYLQRHPHMNMDLWYVRAYTGREHRMNNVAVALSIHVLNHLEDRFVDGTDTRGAGYCIEIESAGLRTFDLAVWEPYGITFMGLNEHGHFVRVRFIPGARAPLPA